MLDLSIIIVNWNTQELLAGCLNSIYAHEPDVLFEILVVDNASSDGSVAMVQGHYPSVQIITNQTNAGFAKANNQAIKLSKGRYVLLLNSDTVVSPGSLDTMVHFLNEQPKAAAVAPKLVNPDGSFQASYADFPTLLSEFLLITGLARRVIGPHAPSPTPTAGEVARSVDWVAGAAILVRRSVIDEIGGLDEGYFLYSEETDWCWRMQQAGWQVWYLPDVQITHIGGASSSKRSQESYVNLYMSKLLFFKKSYGMSYAWILRVLFLAVAAAKLVSWLLLWPFSRATLSQQVKQQKMQRELALIDSSRRIQLGR